jgi:hypothetical protein
MLAIRYHFSNEKIFFHILLGNIVIYDLLVVGNGLAAQTLLFDLIKSSEIEDMNCQNFSIAQIYAEDLAPACSTRSTSTISLNGIEDGVSELGDTLRKGFFAFESFYNEYSLPFIESVNQFITATDKVKLEALKRRYKNLIPIKNESLSRSFDGVKLSSYIVDPNQMSNWFNSEIERSNIHRVEDFLMKFDINSEGIIESHTHKGEIIKSRKILLCTGAYHSIFSAFFPLSTLKVNHQVVAGSYLQKKVSLPKGFILTIDGHNLLYRKSDQHLVLGSASQKGPIQTSDLSVLNNIFHQMKDLCMFDLGHFEDFKVINGLRHKASKRIPICGFLDESKKIGIINGLYKNGYSLPFYFSKLMARQILNP